MEKQLSEMNTVLGTSASHVEFMAVSLLCPPAVGFLLSPAWRGSREGLKPLCLSCPPEALGVAADSCCETPPESEPVGGGFSLSPPFEIK